MKNKISILMHVNTFLAAVSLCVIIIALIMGFGVTGAAIYFTIALVYLSLNILLSPFVYKYYKRIKTDEMLDFSYYVSVFFSYILFAISIYCIVLFSSTFSFMYGAFPFIISLFLLLISLTIFGVSLYITISKLVDFKKKNKQLIS